MKKTLHTTKRQSVYAKADKLRIRRIPSSVIRNATRSYLGKASNIARQSSAKQDVIWGAIATRVVGREQLDFK